MTRTSSATRRVSAATGFAVERGLKLTRDDQIRRDAITRVMCDLELDFCRFRQEWNIEFGAYFADAVADLRPLADDGLVQIMSDRISVTPSGRLFLRNIGMCFDRYLKMPPPATSRAIPVRPERRNTPSGAAAPGRVHPSPSC